MFNRIEIIDFIADLNKFYIPYGLGNTFIRFDGFDAGNGVMLYD
jgi:hypothetical protein